jgi:hypothetical protein
VHRPHNLLPFKCMPSWPAPGQEPCQQDGGGATGIGARHRPRTLEADAHRRTLAAGRRARSCRCAKIFLWATLPDVSRTDNRCSLSPGCLHHSSRRRAADEPSIATATRSLRVIPQTVTLPTPALHRKRTLMKKGTPTAAKLRAGHANNRKPIEGYANGMLPLFVQVACSWQIRNHRSVLPRNQATMAGNICIALLSAPRGKADKSDMHEAAARRPSIYSDRADPTILSFKTGIALGPTHLDTVEKCSVSAHIRRAQCYPLLASQLCMRTMTA